MWKAPQPACKAPCWCPAFTLEHWMDLPVSAMGAHAPNRSCFQEYLSFKAQLTSLLSTTKDCFSSFPPPIVEPTSLQHLVLAPQQCARHTGLFALPQTHRAHSHLPNQWPSPSQGRVGPPEGPSLTTLSRIASRIPHCLTCLALLFFP